MMNTSWIYTVLLLTFIIISEVDGNRVKQLPSWKRQACEGKEGKEQSANARYSCSLDGEVRCNLGWTGDLCNVPICKKGCDPQHGYCNMPEECRCRLGFAGELCDRCALLPGCHHGTCNKSFECTCQPGWDGLFCTQAICKEGCHNIRGFCEIPGECRCRLGWSGENCTECQVVPGCKNGYCKKPLDCLCKPGWTGLLCQNPVCRKGCNLDHAYCEAPDQCRCRVGWWGDNCDVCYPYPGCVHGTCQKPWECRCQPGWTGFLCDQKIATCDSFKSDTREPYCLNEGTCFDSLMKEGRNMTMLCNCSEGFSGSRCQYNNELNKTRLPVDGFGGITRLPWNTSVIRQEMSACGSYKKDAGESYCLNGGTCFDSLMKEGTNMTVCNCSVGFSGPRCQYIIEIKNRLPTNGVGEMVHHPWNPSTLRQERLSTKSFSDSHGVDLSTKGGK